MLILPHLAALAVVSLCLVLPSEPAAAQSYPTKQVKFVVPFSAGGLGDTLARVLGHHLSERFQQTVIAENRSGAGGNIGADAVAKATPDGHTLMVGSNSLAISPGLYKKLSYDPLKDLAPVTMIGGTPLLLVVHPDFPAKSLSELIALAKAKPGEIAHASPGLGTVPHLAIELLKKQADIKMQNIPYRGVMLALNDVISGHVPVLLDFLPIVGQHVRSGKVRALATTGLRRSEALPDVPTMAEAGFPNFEAGSWLAVFTTGGTPRPVIDKLHAEITAVLALPVVRERLTALGVDPVAAGPDEVAAILRSDVSKWSAVIRDAGIARLD